MAGVCGYLDPVVPLMKKDSPQLKKDLVLKALKGKGILPGRPKALAKRLGILPNSYSSFRRLLRELVEEGELVKLQGGRLATPSR